VAIPRLDHSRASVLEGSSSLHYLSLTVDSSLVHCRYLMFVDSDQ